MIFIHDLIENRDDAWTTHANEPWPKTHLPEIIPNVRTLAFGYDATARKMADIVSWTKVEEHAKRLLEAVAVLSENNGNRPVFFVAHGLGGLLCEAALVISAEQD
ncbi:uncharacterized protein EI97DRAFT_351722, partial [Westerdykella ornata]